MTHPEFYFRAKRTDDGQWVFGSFVVLETEYGLLYRIVEKDGSMYRVNPDTVGIHYWGEHNSEELFTGDILHVYHPDKEEVSGSVLIEYCDGCIAVYFAAWDDDYCYMALKDALSWWEMNEHTVTKVGNVHDNPELLEAESILPPVTKAHDDLPDAVEGAVSVLSNLYPNPTDHV